MVTSRRNDAGDDGDDDFHLMRMAQANLSEFARLYDRYVAAVYGYCRRRLGAVAAEDATSIAFMKAMTAVSSFKPGRGTVRSWLFTIAHNVVVDLIRQQARQPLELNQEAINIVDHARSPESAALESESIRDVEAAMKRLTDDQRRVIELRLTGLSGVEIADVLKISSGAVRSLQHRAVMRMRGALCGADKEDWS